MRLIDADKLKKDIAESHLLEDEQTIRNYYKKNYGYSLVTDFTETLVEVFDIIDDAPTIEVPTWIPCSERLPNEKEWIRSYIRNKRASEFIVMIKGANRPTTLYLSRDNYWFDDNNDFYEVVAWMPLPNTRSGQDNEND